MAPPSASHSWTLVCLSGGVRPGTPTPGRGHAAAALGQPQRVGWARPWRERIRRWRSTARAVKSPNRTVRARRPLPRIVSSYRRIVEVGELDVGDVSEPNPGVQEQRDQGGISTVGE